MWFFSFSYNFYDTVKCLHSGFSSIFIFQGSNHLAVIFGDIILAVIDSIFVWFISFTMS